MKCHWIALFVVSALAVAVTIKSPTHLTSRSSPQPQRSVAPATIKTVEPIKTVLPPVLPEPIKRVVELVTPPPLSYTKSPFGWNPPEQCTGNKILFTHSPLDISALKYIVPMGQMGGSHVTPTDHGYLIQNPGHHPLYAPAAGHIVQIGAMGSHQPGVREDYRVTLWHTCTLATIFIHLDELSPRIKEIVGTLQPGQNWYPGWFNLEPIRVQAGEIIGYENGTGIDFSVHDTNIILPGFVRPESYTEGWKPHTVHAFDYFTQPLKAQLEAKSLRYAQPRFGKIDYDVDGRLVGNWFEEGTGGYRGTENKNYWAGHLTFAYDHFDPTFLTISTGSVGEGKQYAVKGNAPDPADISVATGLVKYELAVWEYIIRDESNRLWDRREIPGAALKGQPNMSVGVALVQMLEDRKIKAEFFPDAPPDTVTNFTPAAKIYVR